MTANQYLEILRLQISLVAVINKPTSRYICNSNDIGIQVKIPCAPAHRRTVETGQKKMPLVSSSSCLSFPYPVSPREPAAVVLSLDESWEDRLSDFPPTPTSMESLAIDPAKTLALVPGCPRRRSSSRSMYHRPSGIRKNNSGGSLGDGCTSSIICMDRMSPILGTPSSPHVSHTASNLGSTLATLRNGLNLNFTSPSPSNADGGGGGEGTNGIGGERAWSQVSDRDVQMGGVAPGSNATASGNPNTGPTTGRRRQSVDGVDNPRRRAIIAVCFYSPKKIPPHENKKTNTFCFVIFQCEVCRSRKSRCDGSRPKCRLCIELNAECVYREPGIKLDAGDKLILEHLSRIESMLQKSMSSEHTAMQILGTASSPAVSATTGLSDDVIGSNHLAGNNDHQDGVRSWNNFSSMPQVHSSPALHPLQWPKINQLISRPYSPQHLLQLEMNRTPLQLNTSPTLDLSNTAGHTQAFFGRVNVWYACVNPYNWTSYYRTALSQGFRSGPESCIVLLVLALGSTSTRESISRISPDEEPPGMSYFSAAWCLLPSLMTRTTMLSAQCTILASAYLFYLVRPLEAWTLLSSTSMKLQLLLSTSPPAMLPTAARELSERIYWNALLFESDLLAELELPHSGIIQFQESVGLPCGFEEGEEQFTVSGGRDDLWYFLAGIALRRLLNRVSHLMYSKTSSSTPISSLAPIVAELDYQLTQWYESLPIPVQFPHSRILLSNPVQTVLRLRYFACRTIIFRPYILAVLENEKLAMGKEVHENCRKCLEACIRQLEHITEQLVFLFLFFSFFFLLTYFAFFSFFPGR
jgi:hypothetical protein